MTNEKAQDLTALCQKLNTIDERDKRVVVAFMDGVLIGREIGRTDAEHASADDGHN